MFFQTLFFWSSLLLNGYSGIQVRPPRSSDDLCLLFWHFLLQWWGQTKTNLNGFKSLRNTTTTLHTLAANIDELRRYQVVGVILGPRPRWGFQQPWNFRKIIKKKVSFAKCNLYTNFRKMRMQCNFTNFALSGNSTGSGLLKFIAAQLHISCLLQSTASFDSTFFIGGKRYYSTLSGTNMRRSKFGDCLRHI